jgi:hypothetical protein
MASEHRFPHEHLEGILAFLELGRELNLRRLRRSETRQARGNAAVSVRLEPGPRWLGTDFMWLICPHSRDLTDLRALHIACYKWIYLT